MPACMVTCINVSKDGCNAFQVDELDAWCLEKKHATHVLPEPSHEAKSEGNCVKRVPMRAWMVEDAGVSPAKDGSCSNMSMFKAWLCRHVGLETTKVRRVVLGLDASRTRVSIYKC